MKYAFQLIKEFEYVMLIDDNTILPANYKLDENVFLNDEKISAMAYNVR